MKKLIYTLMLCTLTQTGYSRFMDHFPEDDKTYVPKVDVGYEQYGAVDLHGKKQLVLTFDDGPHNTRTPRLLDILKRENVKATFFINTEKVNAKNEHLLVRMVQEGHIIASHDHNHENDNNEDECTFETDLKKSLTILDDIKKKYSLDQKEVYFRFPYADYGKREDYHHMNSIKAVSQELFAENCINFAFWDIDSGDWVPGIKPAQVVENVISSVLGGNFYGYEVVRRTTKGIKKVATYTPSERQEGDTRKLWQILMDNFTFSDVEYDIVKKSIELTAPVKLEKPIGGGIVLMHDIHEGTIVAAELLIQKAKELGIGIVPLNTLRDFDFSGKKCEMLSR